MVTILPHVEKPKKASFAQKLNQGLSEGLQLGQQLMQAHEQKQRLHQENTAFKKLTGLDIEGINDPRMRQKALELALQGQRDENKFDYNSQLLTQKYDMQMEKERSEFNAEKNDIEALREAFGDEFANVWQSTKKQEGRSHLLKSALEAKSRGEDLNETLRSNQPNARSNQSNSQMGNQVQGQESEWPDYSQRPQGYTPKEWNDEKKTWRKENAPLFQENKTHLKNSINEARDLKRLAQLNKSGKLPEGMARLMLDPETGDIRPFAQLAGLASPETQEYVKIFSRFQNRAKDTFGSRVTNFDLMSYMKQFPSLMNTPAGRERILEMMNINLELDQLYTKALDKVYNKYGLSGISQENADSLAKGFIQDQTEALSDRYFQIDQQNQQEPVELSGVMIDVMGPDGQMYEVDQSEVEQLPEGFRIR